MTYLYETIPVREGGPVKQYEIRQGMKDAPLTRHPETGEAIRRVILGGWGLMPKSSGAGSEGKASGGCGCGARHSCG